MSATKIFDLAPKEYLTKRHGVAIKRTQNQIKQNRISGKEFIKICLEC